MLIQQAIYVPIISIRRLAGIELNAADSDNNL